MHYHFPALVTLLTITLAMILTYRVGQARAKFKISPPAMTGHPDFERVVRVQANTLEHLIMFLPAMWIFAIYLSPNIAGLFGMIWVVARVFYALGYIKEAKRRMPGFIVGVGVTSILLVFGFAGVFWAIFMALLGGKQ